MQFGAVAPKRECKMDRERLHRLLRLGFEKGASDIHFQVGYLPLYRFHGDLVELRYKVLTAKDTEAIAEMLLVGRLPGR